MTSASPTPASSWPSARKRKVDQLPPSVLMREDAELRRVLGQVLDVIAERERTGVVPGGYRLVMWQMIRDAIAYAEDHLGGTDREGQAGFYWRLAERLGMDIEVMP